MVYIKFSKSKCTVKQLNKMHVVRITDKIKLLYSKTQNLI